MIGILNIYNIENTKEKNPTRKKEPFINTIAQIV